MSARWFTLAQGAFGVICIVLALVLAQNDKGAYEMLIAIGGMFLNVFRNPVEDEELKKARLEIAQLQLKLMRLSNEPPLPPVR